MNSKYHGSRRGEIYFYVLSTLFSRDLARVVRFKIHSCFKTGARQRKSHTLVPKQALVDSV